MLRRLPLLLALLLLTGCGGSPSEQRGRPADVDGDGHDDLVLYVDLWYRVPAAKRFLVVVPGSAKGVDASRKVVIPQERFHSWLLGLGIRADLDGDGFGDVLNYGWPGDEQERTGTYVYWGGPHGIAADAVPTQLSAANGPGSSAANGPGSSSARCVAGDFDGDGAADVAMADGGGLLVMYGPFDRDAEPARRTVQRSPTGGEFWRMTADRIEGRRATGLVVNSADDGEQTTGWLLGAGPDGPAKQARKLNQGLASAFGDFDGDGRRDVALGDNGSRNTEAPGDVRAGVAGTLTVYYGDGEVTTFHGMKGLLVSGDFDGDGRDDLAFGGESDLVAGYARQPIWTLWGGPGGLRRGNGIAGMARGTPLASGDYDGDGDDELVLGDAVGPTFHVLVSDGRKVLTRFDLR
ncbi:MAG: hypothetical protein HOV83_18470 [Catenulispora sp.]|nr:hypothetical protein [Catenulispora sp.]